MDEQFGGREREELERMQEDEKEEDENWEDPFEAKSSRRDDRMSGIIRTGCDGDDGIFNNGNFDM